jgi:AcrR family transcriptional regulator
MPEPSPTSTRRGRPRSSGREGDGDPAAQILLAARRLFAEDGIEQTSFSKIAREAGLTQSGVYYWFKNKNEVLAALLAAPDFMPNVSLHQLRTEGGSPGVQLYRFIRRDVTNLCSSTFDLSGIARTAERDRDAFAEYFEAVDELERGLAEMVARGVEQGQLRPVDPDLTALAILTSDEGTQSRFVGPPRFPVAVVADNLAQLLLAGLLADPSTLAAVKAEAEALDATTPADA